MKEFNKCIRQFLRSGAWGKPVGQKWDSGRTKLWLHRWHRIISKSFLSNHSLCTFLYSFLISSSDLITSYPLNYSIQKESSPVFPSLCAFPETQHWFFGCILLVEFRTTFWGSKDNILWFTQILLWGYFQSQFHFGFSLFSGKKLKMSILEMFLSVQLQKCTFLHSFDT